MEGSHSAARFPTTCWSRVLATRDGATPEAREALAELCADYWYPLYAFIRRKGGGPVEALDLTQDYFAHLLERGTVASADSGKGRFRSFLLADCKRESSMADTNRCPNCGAEQTPNAPEGLCPRCLMRQAMERETGAPSAAVGSSTPEHLGLKCLEKNPRRRYSSAQALADDLRAWLDSRSIAARRVGVVERAWLWCKRRPVVAGLAVGMLVACVSGTGGIIYLQGKANADLRTSNLRQKQRFDLADESPSVTLFQSRLARSHMSNAMLLEQGSEPGEALELRSKRMAIGERLADDNPAVTEFRSRLAEGQHGIGVPLLAMGTLTVALDQRERSPAIYQTLGLSEPIIPARRSALANDLATIGNVHRALNWTDEARQGYQRVVKIMEALVKSGPYVTMHRGQLAYAVRRLGLLELAAGDAAGAVAGARRAAELYEGLPSRSRERCFELACCHAALAASAGWEGSGVSTRDAEAVKAMDLLRRAVAEGYRSAKAIAGEVALDPLRHRSDFQLLMLDLAMRDEPFAR